MGILDILVRPFKGDFRFQERDGRVLFFPLGKFGGDGYALDAATETRLRGAARWLDRLPVFGIMLLVIAGVALTSDSERSLASLGVFAAFGLVAGLVLVAIRFLVEMRMVAGLPRIAGTRLDQQQVAAHLKANPPVSQGMLIFSIGLWTLFLAGTVLHLAFGQPIKDPGYQYGIAVVFALFLLGAVVQLYLLRKGMRTGREAGAR